MFVLVERYMDKMSIHDLNNLAINKGITLSEDELVFTYNFIKSNWKAILSNHGKFNILKYKDKYSEENFIKIKDLVKELSNKYSRFL